MELATSIGLSAAHGTGAIWWPQGAVFAADFNAHRYMRDGRACVLEDAFSVSRNSSRLARNTAGQWQSFAADVPARTDLGLIISDGARNGIRNSSMTGAAAGNPASLPSLWTFGGGMAGASYRVAGTGTILGLPYIDLKIAGTTSAASGVAIRYDTHSILTVGKDDDLTFSCYIALAGGSATGFNFLRTCIVEHRANGSTAHTHYLASVRDTIGANIERYTATRKIAHAETASARAELEMTFGSGQTLDMTLRIAAPQLEIGTQATAPILSSGSLGIREKDQLTLKLPAGAYDLEIRFADADAQVIADVGGDVVLDHSDLNGEALVSVVAL